MEQLGARLIGRTAVSGTVSRSSNLLPPAYQTPAVAMLRGVLCWLANDFDDLHDDLFEIWIKYQSKQDGCKSIRKYISG